MIFAMVGNEDNRYGDDKKRKSLVLSLKPTRKKRQKSLAEIELLLAIEVTQFSTL